MELHLNRWTVGTLKHRTKITDFHKKVSRGPYGSLSAYVTAFGKTVNITRRYPDDRLRCNKCGYRKNDS